MARAVPLKQTGGPRPFHPLTMKEKQMATKKSSKTRKITRAKATKKSSVRSGRKAPGKLGVSVPTPQTPIAWE